LLTKSSFGHYRIGQKLYALSGGDCRINTFNMLVQRSADRIASELGELGVVAACWKNQRITLAKVEPKSTVQLSIADHWFEKSGWYRLSSGRLLLALQSNEVINAVVESVGLPSPAEWPEAFSRDKLMKQLAIIRQKRFVAVMRENDHLTSLAVPVKDAAGNDTLCVGTVYMTGRHAADKIRNSINKIAEELHEQLCFHNISMQDINNL
jgi:DNA-binding IclR family transcriptional regulator